MPPQLDQLQKYRRSDVPGKPENETLNSRYIREFVRIKMGLETGLPADKESTEKDLAHFDQNFKLSTGIELAEAKEFKHKQTRGEKAIMGVLTKAKAYLDSKGKPDLFEDMNPKSALSDLERLTKENGDYVKKFPELKEAYFTYRMVRMYCHRIFEVENVAAQSREKQKIEIGGGGLKEGFAKHIDGIKGNFGNMSSAEKLTVIAAAVIGIGMFATSDSPRMERWKEGLWTVVKLGLGGYAANTMWKMFTGKTALTAFNEWTSSTVGNEDFWKKSFHTDAEKTKIVESSIVYLHNYDLVDLAESYQKAKASNTNKIELASVASKDMTPEQVYIALDVFFSQYGGSRDANQNVENLKKRFIAYHPRPKWLEVVSTMLVEDGRLEFKGNLIERTVDNVGTFLTVAWNKAAGTSTGKAFGEGAETVYDAAGTLVTDVAHGTKTLIGTTYGLTKRTAQAAYDVTKGGAEIAISAVEWPVAGVAWFGNYVSERTQSTLGHQPTEQEIREFEEKRLFNILEPHVPHAHSYNLEAVIKDKMQTHILSKEDADLYIKTLKDGKSNGEYNLKYLERPDAIILAIDSPIRPDMADPKKSGEKSVASIKECTDKAWGFLKKQYKFTDEEVARHSKIGFGIHVLEQSVYKLFMQIPKRGTPEFNKQIILGETKAAHDSLRSDVDRK